MFGGKKSVHAINEGLAGAKLRIRGRNRIKELYLAPLRIAGNQRTRDGVYHSKRLWVRRAIRTQSASQHFKGRNLLQLVPQRALPRHGEAEQDAVASLFRCEIRNSLRNRRSRRLRFAGGPATHCQ